MYKKRLNEWDYRKYRTRQVYEDCAENLEGCNGKETILPDEEIEVLPVPVKRVGRFLKRKNADGGPTRNTHSPKSPCNEALFLHD
jgi:hypothetical protein